MSSDISDLILSLIPEDGSSIGNGVMLARLRDHIPDLSEDAYTEARDTLINVGALARGKGRGGSIYRADVADLELTEPAPKKKKATKRRGKKTAGRSARPSEVLSYRHDATRVNNPEVGMVHADSDPDLSLIHI